VSTAINARPVYLLNTLFLSREFAKIGYKVGLIATNEKNVQSLADEIKTNGGEVSPRRTTYEVHHN
jgi:hypothetical protein